MPLFKTRMRVLRAEQEWSQAKLAAQVGVMRIQRWFNSTRCLRWIGQHKSTSLLGTELVNYGTHGLDPLGVSFSLGGTLVNVLFIFLILPCLDAMHRRRGTATASLQ